EHLEIAAVEEGVERRRIELKKSPEEGVGLPGKGKGEALGQVYLVNVSLADIIPDAPDGRQVSLLGKVAGERPHLVRSQGLGRFPPGNGLICPPGTPSPGVFVDYPDFPELAAPAVVHHQTAGEGHHQVRKMQII